MKYNAFSRRPCGNSIETNVYCWAGIINGLRRSSVLKSTGKDKDADSYLTNSCDYACKCILISDPGRGAIPRRQASCEPPREELQCPTQHGHAGRRVLTFADSLGSEFIGVDEVADEGEKDKRAPALVAKSSDEGKSDPKSRKSTSPHYPKLGAEIGTVWTCAFTTFFKKATRRKRVACIVHCFNQL